MQVDLRYFRPADVDLLIGKLQKTHDEPGWIHIASLAEMATSDIDVINPDREREQHHD